MHPVTRVLLLTLGLHSAVEAVAEPLSSSHMLAESTLLGVQASARQSRESGKLSQDSANCVQAIRVTALIPVFESAIAANWSKSETSEIEAFLGTSLGRKFVKMSLLKAAASYGDPPSEPIPLFSGEEVARLQRFQQTSGGQQFLGRTEFAREDSRQAIRQKILELLRSCGAI